MDIDEYIVPSPVPEITHMGVQVQVYPPFAQIAFLSLMGLIVYCLSNVRAGLREKQVAGDIEKSL